jgi:5'-nucleotidase
MRQQLKVAISSRALFDLDAAHAVFDHDGLEAYAEYQIQHEDTPLDPGVAFPLIRRLLDLRDPQTDEALVEVILVSRNDSSTGLRVFNSIEHYGLPITRAAFTGGRAPFGYIRAFEADLFLSANAEDVCQAIARGHAAARVYKRPDVQGLEALEELRIAFDGDAVLFSDEAEQVYQSAGLQAFWEHEQSKIHQPLAAGPFQPFLKALHDIQKRFATEAVKPIRTALVTARNAPSHKRAIHTLRAWGITIDETFFLGGWPKTPILREFQPHIYFDDQTTHCEPAARHVPTGHVPYGVKNQSIAGVDLSDEVLQ